ncbi:MAG: transposase [Pseudomonadota bacterium]
MSEDALDAWIAPGRRRRGGQGRYANLAVEAMLVLGAAFRLPLRQTEGFARCLIGLLGLTLPVPDQSTLVRRRRMVTVEPHVSGRSGPVDLVLESTGRKIFGPGKWARNKHGEKRCSWREVHIAVDASTGEVLAHALTDADTSDPAMAGEHVASAA